MNKNNDVRKRKLTAVVVGATVAACIVVPAAWSGRYGSPSTPETPWPLPSLVGETPEGAEWSSDAGLGGPAALMYATPTCPFCKDELQSWSALVEEGARPNLWIIADADAEGDLSWVPPALRSRTIADVDDSIARSLSVRYVPVTYWTDAVDTVRVVRVGRSTRTQLTDAMDAVGMPR